MENKPKIYQLRPSLSVKYIEFGTTGKLNKDYKKNIEDIKKGAISFTAFKKKVPGDLATFCGVYTGFTSNFIDLLIHNGITNFNKYKITIEPSIEIPNYYYLDLKCKPIKRYTKRKKGFMALSTIFLNINDWGREDLFTIEETLVILCTEKVKELVEKNGLKGFRFIEIKSVN